MKEHVYISINRLENLIRENSILRSQVLIAEGMAEQRKKQITELEEKIHQLETDLGKTYSEREMYHNWWSSEADKSKKFEKELEDCRKAAEKETEPCQTPAG